MKQDIEKNVKYVLKNIDDLELSPVNKEYIYKIVELLKFQIKRNYIYKTLSENEKLVKHIEGVIRALNEEEIKINKEIDIVLDELDFKYKEYTPIDDKDEIFPGFKAKLEENRKKNYESEKDKAEKDFEEKKTIIEDRLKELKAEKDTIEDFKDQIISTSKFIEANLNEEFDIDSYNNNYNKIINDCAISILGKAINTENEKKLFTVENENYIPIQDELLKFFEVGRNPELSQELIDFYNNINSIEKNKNIAKKNDENYSQTLNKREDIKDALNDNSLIREVEKKLSIIHDLFNELKVVHLEKIKNALDTINYQNTKSKTIISFFDKIIKKEDNDNGSKELAKKDEKDIYDKLVKEYQNIQNYRDSEKKSLIYEFYFMLAHLKINTEEVNNNLNDIPEYLLDLNNNIIEEIALIYTFIEKFELDEIHEIINEIINSKVNEVQSSYDENLKNLNDFKSREEELFEQLSDKAKKYHKKYSSEFSLETFNNLSLDVLSPLIASLVLETIFYIDEIKTPEELQKFGIIVSDEELKEYKELSINTILPNMENFLNNSKNIILVNKS